MTASFHALNASVNEQGAAAGGLVGLHGHRSKVSSGGIDSSWRAVMRYVAISGYPNVNAYAWAPGSRNVI